MLPLLAACIFQIWYNQNRFGVWYKLFDFDHFYLNASQIGGQFNLRRVPDLFRSYFRFSGSYFISHLPYFRMLQVKYKIPEIFFEWREETIPLSISSSWLIVLGLGGIIPVLRSGWRAVVGLIAFAIQALLILTYLFVTQRFAAELLPFFLFASFFAIRYFPFERMLSRYLLICMALLVLFSIFATLGSTLHFIAHFDDQAPVSLKKPLMNAFYPVDLPHAPGRKVYLSDMEPDKATWSFVPPEKDSAFEGAPISIKGHYFKKGLGLHASIDLHYLVPEGAVAFQAVAGISDAKLRCGKSSVDLLIKDQDGTILYGNSRVLPDSPPLPISISMEGVKEINISVGDAGDGIDCDHLNLGEAAFVMGP